ncbi:hypothetical protein BJ912DRAFT_665438 [Pholiota molesta]|nr:hypothetical protein BJ912DRAFT_665438 [Pholiota molesta]
MLIRQLPMTEWGEGGSDASTQAGLSMKRLWSEDDMPGVTYVRDRCSCPTLMLVGGGPWLGVLGGVFTDKVIVQRLTDMMWIAQSSTYEDSRAYRFAQTMVALRESLLVLKEYYKKLIEDDVPKFTMHEPHPRFYPYPTSCEVDSLTLRWTYVEALDSYSTCVTYLAEVDSENNPSLGQGLKLVIKFVDRYGDEAHRLLAADGHAPKLWYCGPLTSSMPSTSPLVSPSPLPGIALGPLRMVVMDHVSEAASPKISIPMREQLTNILTKLHQEGYVFGDLRRPNVFLDKKGLVKLIDFDWAGPYDRSLPETLQDDDPLDLIPCDIPAITEKSGNTSFATYPMDLSKQAFEKTGAEDLKAIRPVHDWRMLRMIELQDGS